MSTALRSAVVQQFRRPKGFFGRLAGFIMRVRPSNRERNRRTLDLLDIQPDDDVLEIGFGPGLAIKRAAELARRGRVVGLDHSELMVAQASRRNARAIAERRVELHHGSVEQLPRFSSRFDKVFAVNVFLFWEDPVAVLRGLSEVMKPGGTIALTFQSRKRGATSGDTRAGAERIAGSLREAGFVGLRIETLPMRPVDAACVVGRATRQDRR